jgi:hypothetical protein
VIRLKHHSVKLIHFGFLIRGLALETSPNDDSSRSMTSFVSSDSAARCAFEALRSPKR